MWPWSKVIGTTVNCSAWSVTSTTTLSKSCSSSMCMTCDLHQHLSFFSIRYLISAVCSLSQFHVRCGQRIGSGVSERFVRRSAQADARKCSYSNRNRFRFHSKSPSLIVGVRKKADFFMKGEVYGEFGSLLTPTQTISSLDVRIGHRFKVPRQSANVLQVLENIPSNVLLTYLLSILWCLLLVAFRLHQSGYSTCRVGLHLLQFAGVWIRQTPSARFRFVRFVRRLTVLAAITSFVVNVVFETSVKTDRVVLDLSSLINSPEEVVRTDRMMVWVDLERLNDEFSQAKPSSWKRRAWEKPRYHIDKSGHKQLLMFQNKMYQYIGLSNIVYL